MNQTEIARKLGVSQSAVSLVLHDATTTRVSAEKKAEIIRLLKGNVNANSAGCKRTWNIGYLTDPTQNIHSEFFQESLHGTEEECNHYHYSLMLECMRGKNINLLGKNKVDGLIIRSGKVLEFIKETALPFPAVLLNCSTDALLYDVVMPDNRGGMFKIADYLKQRGIKSVAFIGNNQPHSPYSCNYQERTAGFAEACRMQNMILTVANVELPFGSPDAADKIAEIVAGLCRHAASPKAIVCVNHFYAAVVKSAFPGLTVVAGDNKMERGFENRSLPMLVQDGFAMGKLAVELLMKRINDPERKIVRLNCDMELCLPQA